MNSQKNVEIPFYKTPKFIVAMVVLFIVVFVLYTNGHFTRSIKSKKSNKSNAEQEEIDSDDEDADKFVVSGGRDDSNGGDWALKDKIHDINERQRKYVRNSQHTYRYDPRVDTAAPTVYSPEDELQRELYNA